MRPRGRCAVMALLVVLTNTITFLLVTPALPSNSCPGVSRDLASSMASMQASPANRVDVEFHGEFGFELTTILPFAYHLHEKGELNSTVGCGNMSPYYFFSPHHIDLSVCHRSFSNSKTMLRKYDFPLWWGTWGSREWERWRAPPLRAHYQHMPLHSDFPKALSWPNLHRWPAVVIVNKYTEDWGHEPSNFIDLDTLDRLLKLLTPFFTVVYNRPIINGTAGADDQVPLDLGDHEFVASWQPPKAEWKRPLRLQDIPGDFNLNQLLVYSRCTRFISVQGGPMVLPTYFGGVSIVLHREGRELTSNSYENAFPRLSGSLVMPVDSNDDLVELVESVFVRPFVVGQNARQAAIEEERRMAARPREQEARRLAWRKQQQQ